MNWNDDSMFSQMTNNQRKIVESFNSSRQIESIDSIEIFFVEIEFANEKFSNSKFVEFDD